MTDLSTLSRAKDWALVGLFGIIVSLLAGFAADNRSRIESNDRNIEDQQRQFNQFAREYERRLATVETEVKSCRAEARANRDRDRDNDR